MQMILEQSINRHWRMATSQHVTLTHDKTQNYRMDDDGSWAVLMIISVSNSFEIESHGFLTKQLSVPITALQTQLSYSFPCWDIRHTTVWSVFVCNSNQRTLDAERPHSKWRYVE